LDEVTQGIFDTGGNLSTTIADWKRENVNLYVLDVKGEPIENIEKSERIGFILSDDLIFTDEEQKLMVHLPRISLGKKWLQGHSSITIVHHFLDKKE